MNVTSTNMALWILLLLLLLIAGPLLTIWALNTLFPALHIPYAWDTWAAVVLLTAAGYTGGVSLKRN